ncbi:MAG: metal-dependent phosphohydrolase [Pseudomonadota bacterium]
MNPFHSKQILIEDFLRRLQDTYFRVFDYSAPEHSHVIQGTATMAMEIIANSDALYHTIEHSMMVTLVGQEILRGKMLSEGNVTSSDWVNFITALLCHDIGYVRGICPGDTNSTAIINEKGDSVAFPNDATDVFLAPYHIERGKIFVRERFASNPLIDQEIVAKSIENTRFPVPLDTDPKDNESFQGLVRAADLIGQLADPDYIRKLPALFYEFREIGADKDMGYNSPHDLMVNYPEFYWKMVSPHVPKALEYLKITYEGRSWISGLYNHIFAEEHRNFL